MKKIGLIGGMSWESTQEYYKLLNQGVQKKLGGLHSCPCIIESVDFDEIAALQHANDWEALNVRMSEIAVQLEQAGAELIILCTNTMHLCFDSIESAVAAPVIHIADAAGEQLKANVVCKVLLLGTQFTMEKDFYRERLRNRFDIEVVVPGDDDRQIIHQVIYDELVKGVFSDDSRKQYVTIIDKAIKEHEVEGVILGCTEIPLLVRPSDVAILTYDTTQLHALAALKQSLSSEFVFG